MDKDILALIDDDQNNFKTISKLFESTLSNPYRESSMLNFNAYEKIIGKLTNTKAK